MGSDHTQKKMEMLKRASERVELFYTFGSAVVLVHAKVLARVLSQAPCQKEGPGHFPSPWSKFSSAACASNIQKAWFQAASPATGRSRRPCDGDAWPYACIEAIIRRPTVVHVWMGLSWPMNDEALCSEHPRSSNFQSVQTSHDSLQTIPDVHMLLGLQT